MRLLALAGAPSTALWKLENGIWSSAGDASGARSLARDGGRLILAGDQGIELRDVGQPLAEGARQTVDWASALVGGVPSGIDAADDGRVAAALVAGDTIKLVTLDPKNPDVAPRALNPAPASPFGPSVAWLDARRLLVLSTDNMQISRLAVVDTGIGTMGPLSVLGGVRSFALSPSRGLLAVVKDEGVHIATAARWLTGESPALSIESGPEEVFWGVAVDGTDTRMAMFSGTLTADGDVTGVHDIGLELRSGRWTRSFDQSVPFAEAIAQVWLD